MKRLLFTLLPALLLACQSKQQPQPLPFLEMEEVLLQIHLADVYSEQNSAPLVIRQQARYEQYQEVLEGLQVDSARFWASYDYYLAHPVLLDSMYGRLVDRINQMTVDDASRNAQGEKLPSFQEKEAATEEK
jgi:hypothetical protein